MNAIGTKLRYPKELGLPRWRFTIEVDAVAESVREERADAGRDGQTVSRANGDRGKKIVFFVCSADSQAALATTVPVDGHFAVDDDHTRRARTTLRYRAYSSRVPVFCC